jgi:hypothetical protein
MGASVGFQRGPRAYKGKGELGLRWVASSAIGQRWRCSWTVSCAESRDVSGCVGGVRVRSEDGRVQSGAGRFQSWRGLAWAWGCRETVALASACHAVLVRVKRGVGRGRGAREHDAHSGRTGRPGDITLA